MGEVLASVETRLGEEDKSALDAPLTAAEVAAAVRATGADKSPAWTG